GAPRPPGPTTRSSGRGPRTADAGSWTTSPTCSIPRPGSSVSGSGCWTRPLSRSTRPPGARSWHRACGRWDSGRSASTIRRMSHEVVLDTGTNARREFVLREGRPAGQPAVEGRDTKTATGDQQVEDVLRARAVALRRVAVLEHHEWPMCGERTHPALQHAELP